jgi:hypothetical protein
VNPTGLVIEQTHAETVLQEGHAAWAISGVIRNVTDHVVTSPPLRISLLNAEDKRVAGQITTLGNSRIPPGESRHFVTSILDAPASVATLVIEFAVGAPAGQVRVSAASANATAPAPAFTLRGADNATAPPAAANAAVSDAPGLHMPPEPASAPPSNATAPR